jgi:hypothetical protein
MRRSPKRAERPITTGHDEAPEQDGGERDEHRRRRHPGVQEIHHEESAAAPERDRMDAVMQIEVVDSVVAEEGHEVFRSVWNRRNGCASDRPSGGWRRNVGSLHSIDRHGSEPTFTKATRNLAHDSAYGNRHGWSPDGGCGESAQPQNMLPHPVAPPRRRRASVASLIRGFLIGTHRWSMRCGRLQGVTFPQDQRSPA